MLDMQSLKTLEKQLSGTLREKEQLQCEHNKLILVKNRLENLCRELHSENKRVENETLQHQKQEELKKKELSDRFHKTINEITASLHENNLKNCKLKEENEEITKRFKCLLEQCEVREQHMDKLMKHKMLEVQLAEAQLAKFKLEHMEEQEKILREKQNLLQELHECQQKLSKQQDLEIQLRTQLNSNVEKYNEFQLALKKSNHMYSEFKKEMEKMTKKIKLLEKETHAWKSKFEMSNLAFAELHESKKKQDVELSVQLRKVQQLEKLCRTLQKERMELQESINKNSQKLQPSVRTEGVQTENETFPGEGAGVLPVVPEDDFSKGGSDSTQPRFSQTTDELLDKPMSVDTQSCALESDHVQMGNSNGS